MGEAEPTLFKAFNPWDEITTPEALAGPFARAGVPSPSVVAVASEGRHQLDHPDRFWDIVLGSGYRAAADALTWCTGRPGGRAERRPGAGPPSAADPILDIVTGSRPGPQGVAEGNRGLPIAGKGLTIRVSRLITEVTMPVGAIEREIGDAYARLAEATAMARRCHEHYLDDLGGSLGAATGELAGDGRGLAGDGRGLAGDGRGLAGDGRGWLGVASPGVT